MSNIICSKCNYIINLMSLPNFCPSCGVKFSQGNITLAPDQDSSSNNLEQKESEEDNKVNLLFGIMVTRKTRFLLRIVLPLVWFVLVFIDKYILNGALYNLVS